jgi:hypothetical protein
LPHTLSLGQGQKSISQLSAVSILCWFADFFPILQHRLTLDVAHWLRRWALWTAICLISGSSLSPIHCRPFCLSSHCLLKVHAEISSLLLPPSPVHPEHPIHSAACSFSVPCLLFNFFWWARVSLSRGLCWLIPGVAVEIPRTAYLLTCWSASPKQVWSQHLEAQEPSCFLSVTRCRQALYGLRVRVSEFWFFLAAFFYQVWLQHLSKIFDLRSSCCLLLPSSHHLGSSPSFQFSCFNWVFLVLSFNCNGSFIYSEHKVFIKQMYYKYSISVLDFNIDEICLNVFLLKFVLVFYLKILPATFFSLIFFHNIYFHRFFGLVLWSPVS